MKSSFYNNNLYGVDFRLEPDKYSIGRGEQGVLMVEPYKSEILPHWRFRTPDVAKKSAEKIYALFLQYKKENDFVGMDMARKFLQMGYTRSRRYANHASGRKYISNPQNEASETLEKQARKNVLPQAKDWETNEKAQSAKIFYEYYLKAKSDEEYLLMKKQHKEKYE